MHRIIEVAQNRLGYPGLGSMSIALALCFSVAETPALA